MSVFFDAQGGDDVAEPVLPDPVLGRQVSSQGVSLIPAFGFPAPPVPVSEGEFWCVGSVGGAGVSTLVRLINDVSGSDGSSGVSVGEGLDPERFSSVVLQRDPALYGGVPYGGRVWVVAPVTSRGLDGASSLLSRHSQGLVPWDVLGLVLIHPEAPASKEVINRAKAVRALYPVTVALPWLDDTEAELPRRVVEALKVLISHSGSSSSEVRPGEEKDSPVVVGKVLRDGKRNS